VKSDEVTTSPVDLPSAEESTRRRIFDAIMANGNITATQLARQLGITPAAVRRHLELLESQGLVMARTPSHRAMASRGRPAKTFRITDAGRERFGHSYSELAVQAIAQLLAVVGPDGIDKLAAAHFTPIQDGFSATLASNPAEPRPTALAAAFAARGYAANVSQMAGGTQLCQHHCPLEEVARLYPEICTVETSLIAQLLHSHVQRLATIAHGDGICTTNIPTPPASGAGVKEGDR